MRISFTSPQPHFLIVGLGNPGREYNETRHNAGFMVVDRLANRAGVKFKRRRFQAHVADIHLHDQRILLMKPRTYVNLSGRAISGAIAKLGLPLDRLLVVLDDANLPLGHIRLRSSGSHGGHNGLRSINERLGQQPFPRLRLGINWPKDDDLVSFVLSKFHSEETAEVEKMLKLATCCIETFVRDGLNTAMTNFNS